VVFDEIKVLIEQMFQLLVGMKQKRYFVRPTAAFVTDGFTLFLPSVMCLHDSPKELVVKYLHFKEYFLTKFFFGEML